MSLATTPQHKRSFCHASSKHHHHQQKHPQKGSDLTRSVPRVRMFATGYKPTSTYLSPRLRVKGGGWLCSGGRILLDEWAWSVSTSMATGRKWQPPPMGMETLMTSMSFR
mmetsp:Transcript_28020/g.69970  ORF Transcript_28020/g.69970 Transcript_28020/m.69970 type:complete len:110 (-) Transcript_28020:471-800(-)